MCANNTRRVLVPFSLAMLWVGSSAVFASDQVSVSMTGIIQAPACTLNSTPSDLESTSGGVNPAFTVALTCPESGNAAMQTRVHTSSDIALKTFDNPNGELKQGSNTLQLMVSQPRAGTAQSSGSEEPLLTIDYP